MRTTAEDSRIMTRTRFTFAALGALLSFWAVTGGFSGDRVAAAEAGERVHLQLDRSAPEADATVTAPEELRLWFSQVPDASATSARIIRDGSPLDVLGEMQQDASDGKVFAASFTGRLAPGSYTVAWRTMAADGHVVRGDFDFTVAAD